MEAEGDSGTIYEGNREKLRRETEVEVRRETGEHLEALRVNSPNDSCTDQAEFQFSDWWRGYHSQVLGAVYTCNLPIQYPSLKPLC